MENKKRMIGNITEQQYSKRAYYYLKNGMLHKRFLVVRAIPLTKEEEKELKDTIQAAQDAGYKKQEVLEDAYAQMYVKKGRDYRYNNIVDSHMKKRFEV